MSQSRESSHHNFPLGFSPGPIPPQELTPVSSHPPSQSGSSHGSLSSYPGQVPIPQPIYGQQSASSYMPNHPPGPGMPSYQPQHPFGFVATGGHVGPGMYSAAVPASPAHSLSNSLISRRGQYPSASNAGPGGLSLTAPQPAVYSPPFNDQAPSQLTAHHEPGADPIMYCRYGCGRKARLTAIQRHEQSDKCPRAPRRAAGGSSSGMGNPFYALRGRGGAAARKAAPAGARVTRGYRDLREGAEPQEENKNDDDV